MPIESEVIKLSESYKPEVIEIISQAFFEAPQIPALIDKPQHTKTIVLKLIDLYKGTGTNQMFGIKKDDKLVCIGFCVDSNLKPGFYKQMKFGFSLFKTLGFEGVRQFSNCDTKKPKYDKTCLELMFFGTLSSSQKKGYGQQMLNFLYDFAKKNNYGGVTGVTNCSRPAFKFYMRDGWVIDNEFYIGKYKLCWVRKIV
ncbi:MAG: GNAT family N-acetyltransferase [Candidatus Thermoplasmatota archaeon]|nr:GNAT family N-acetyltransferase [Candidatus Thermoplasmatota archaeon]